MEKDHRGCWRVCGGHEAEYDAASQAIDGGNGRRTSVVRAASRLERD